MNSHESAAPQWWGIAALAVPLAIGISILAVRRLGLVVPLLVATARMVLQLLALGFVLHWIFQSDNPWVVLGVAGVMLVVSAGTVSARQREGSRLLQVEVLGTLGLVVALVMAIAVKLALGVTPWYHPQVVIPLLGMLLGNSVSGVTLAAERFDSELRQNRDLVEQRLALGATSRQAAHEALQAALRAALTPTINSMMIAGIVAIPGMMTGQLLQGADPSIALRYQIMIYIGIAGTSCLSSLLLLALRLRHFFTPFDQLRPARLDLPRNGQSRLLEAASSPRTEPGREQPQPGA
jgi:putative ABC transport system permease protein